MNLFVASNAEIEVDGVRVRLSQETEYPWDGKVRVTIHPERRIRMRLLIRSPRLVAGTILGGTSTGSQGGRRGALAVPQRRKAGCPRPVDGYASVDREWNGTETASSSLCPCLCER